jgi:deazaflavin-dependent oxidoreductase (nitroreductase family)
MNLGSEHDPAWSLNLDARPDAEITVDGREIPVTARRLAGTERERLWRLYSQRLPAVERFRAIAGREIPAWLLERRSA